MRSRRRRARTGGPFALLREHSLGLVAVGILTAWICLYVRSDPSRHAGAFFGNAIADWTGVVFIVFGTKHLFERGSAESRRPPRERGPLRTFLVSHSLTLVLVATAGGWLLLYRSMDPGSRWGAVVGNVLSEWVQMIGIVVLTKKLVERGSKESPRASS